MTHQQSKNIRMKETDLLIHHADGVNELYDLSAEEKNQFAIKPLVYSPNKNCLNRLSKLVLSPVSYMRKQNFYFPEW